MKRNSKLKEQLIVSGLAVVLGTSLIPLSAKATNEYTVLGVGSFTNGYLI